MERILRVVSISLLASLLLVQPSVSVTAASGPSSTYLVLYKQNAVPSDAAARLAAAGGALVHAYDSIGVAIATSNDAHFREMVVRDARVQDVGLSARGAVRLRAPRLETGPSSGPTSRQAPAQALAPTGRAPALLADGPAVDPTAQQWDMRQIHAPEAHAISGGSRSVLVGDIDTGVDLQHPDLKDNIDVADSVSCIGGTPNQTPAAWDDAVGHGTHTAGLIAASGATGGIVGVAPNVQLAIIKAGDDNGFFFPDAVVCAFMWAASHHVDITNNSYFADPYFFTCPSDPAQAAILIAELRAILFAEANGVAVVAALDNFSDDLANPTQDTHSPTNGTPITRAVDRGCMVLPAEAPGVIGVSSTGLQQLKAASSNYGLGIVDVAGPGGDSRLQPDPTSIGGGRVLSTWPARLVPFCPRLVTVPTGDPNEPTAAYCYQQGTSMAAPHVAGVAALILSRQPGIGDLFGFAKVFLLQAMLQRTADPLACPSATDLARYAAFPALDNGAPQTCQGTSGFNSWYGYGEVDALNAVRGD